MNPLVLHFASGNSLYTGSLALLVAFALSFLKPNKWLARGINLIASLAIAFIIMASAPLPLWLYALLLTAFIAWFLIHNFQRLNHKQPRLIATLSFFSLVAVFLVHEALHLPNPTLPPHKYERLYVVGDSISSGLHLDFPPWPDVFASTNRVAVTNLSRAGISCEEALPLARKIPPDASALVLLEIGGNDLLGGTSAEDFRRHLDALCREVAKPNRTVLMIKLPLLPHFIPHGRIQRELAAQYNIPLIPKRHLVSAIAGGEATTDGLHLSREGTIRLSQTLAPILLPQLQTSAQ